MPWWGMGRPGVVPDSEVVERLRWLLKLRWLVVPVFIAASTVSDLLLARRGTPWTVLILGGALLAANAVYAALLDRPGAARWLLLWARFEAYAIVAVPVALSAAGREEGGALRFGVFVGVVGAAAVLPRRGDVLLVALWAIAALVFGDTLAAGFEPTRVPASMVARWMVEAVIVGTVAVIVAHLQSLREWASDRARAAQEVLERSRAEWEAAFDDLRELVVVTDAEGRVIRANRAFARLLDLSGRDLLHRPLSQLLRGHPDRWWSRAGDGIVEVDDPVFGSLFEVSSTRVEDRVVRVARDVGEPRRLQARIVQADKLASVGLLATNVAHELNNPSAFVTSNLSELQRYIGAYESLLAGFSALGLEAGVAERVRLLLARPDVAFARREAQNAVAESLAGMERIRQIVTNLRSLARPDPAGDAPVPVELGEVVQAVVRTAALDLRSASAQVNVPSALWVLGRRGELVDVALNLVVNAIQARAEDRPNRISVSLRREEASAVLQVTDTGKGIASPLMKRLFEPYFTTKVGEGTGLGLSLARKIVLGHGGSIDVASELGIGSTFTVRLPALDVAAPGPPRAESGAA